MLLFQRFWRKQVAGEEKITTKSSTQRLNKSLATFFAFWKLLWDIKAALESTRWSRSCSDTLWLFPALQRAVVPPQNEPSLQLQPSLTSALQVTTAQSMLLSSAVMEKPHVKAAPATSAALPRGASQSTLQSVPRPLWEIRR